MVGLPVVAVVVNKVAVKRVDKVVVVHMELIMDTL